VSPAAFRGGFYRPVTGQIANRTSHCRMRQIKLIIFLLACAFAVQRAIQEIRISSQEKSPTHISIDRWDTYCGQRWLEVEGNLAVGRAVIKGATDEFNSAAGKVYAYVPITSSTDDPNETVHAVAVIGPVPGDTARRTLQDRAGWTTIQGEIAPDGCYDNARLMPAEKLDPNAVYVNENTHPNGDEGMWAFLWFSLAGLLFCLYVLGLQVWRWSRKLGKNMVGAD
jgi:hypothetical protein